MLVMLMGMGVGACESEADCLVDGDGRWGYLIWTEGAAAESKQGGVGLVGRVRCRVLT
jgi:hypothetical protein